MYSNLINRSIAAVLAAALLVSSPVSAQQGDNREHPEDAKFLCMKFQCIFMPSDVDYLVFLKTERNVFHAFFGPAFPKDIVSFYFRSADSTMWAKMNDGRFRLLGPPATNMKEYLPGITAVRLTRTVNKEAVETRDYPLVNEARTGPPKSTVNKGSNDGGSGVVAAIVGLGALWLWSEATQAREEAEQKECMDKCKLARGRCIELCTKP